MPTAITRVQGFYALPPCRLADTRGASGVPIGGPALGRRAPVRTFNVRELCGLPGNAIAISYNVTVTGPTSAGDLRLFPGGSTSPASVINYVSGQTRANNGIVPLAADGTLGVQCDQASGTTHLILDVNGYFAATDMVPTPVGQKVQGPAGARGRDHLRQRDRGRGHRRPGPRVPGQSARGRGPGPQGLLPGRARRSARWSRASSFPSFVKPLGQGRRRAERRRSCSASWTRPPSSRGPRSSTASRTSGWAGTRRAWWPPTRPRSRGRSTRPRP